MSFKDHVLGSRSPDCSKVGINWKNDITIFWHDFIVIFLMFPHFSCQVQLLCSSFMSISLLILVLWKFSFIKGWPEIRLSETPLSGFCSILGQDRDVWILGQDRDVKLGPNNSNKLLLNAAKCQGYSFYRFWVIKGKPAGKESGGGVG